MSLIRPQLEYCAAVWDPHTATSIYAIERVQRRAARWVLHRYHNTSSVSGMLDQLNWTPLQDRRSHSRLALMYKINRGLVDIDPHTYLTSITRPTRHTHQYGYLQIPAVTEAYRCSFFPRTVREWNALPLATIISPSVASFKTQLTKLPSVI